MSKRATDLTGADERDLPTAHDMPFVVDEMCGLRAVTTAIA